MWRDATFTHRKPGKWDKLPSLRGRLARTTRPRTQHGASRPRSGGAREELGCWWSRDAARSAPARGGVSVLVDDSGQVGDECGGCGAVGESAGEHHQHVAGVATYPDDRRVVVLMQKSDRIPCALTRVVEISHADLSSVNAEGGEDLRSSSPNASAAMLPPSKQRAAST